MEGQPPSRLNRDGIRIHDPADFDGMRAAGRLVADILDRIAPAVAPGVGTGELDAAIHDMVRASGATSATVGYKGYRHASCISVNHVVCHGIPGAKIPGRYMSCASAPGSSKVPGVTARMRTARRAKGRDGVMVTAAA